MKKILSHLFSTKQNSPGSYHKILCDEILPVEWLKGWLLYFFFILRIILFTPWFLILRKFIFSVFIWRLVVWNFAHMVTVPSSWVSSAGFCFGIHLLIHLKTVKYIPLSILLPLSLLLWNEQVWIFQLFSVTKWE